MDVTIQQESSIPQPTTSPVFPPREVCSRSAHEKVHIPKRSYSQLLDSTSEMSKRVIVPAKHLEKSWIPLSILDKFILPIYIPVYFIFDSIPSTSFNEFVEKLQTSLAEVLVPYYPFAGRLRKNPATQSWDIHCDNGGAEFRVIYVDEELKRTKFCKPSLELRLLAPRLDAVPKDDGIPIPALSVQVSRFKCGAVALGCSFHHQCGDAYAVSIFMQAWSELAQAKPLSLVPNHNRSTYVPDTLTAQSAAPPPVEIVGMKTEKEIQHQQQQQQKRVDTMPSIREDFGEHEMEGFLFEAEDVKALKAMAPPGSTSFEAATAFIVRHVVKASPMPEDQLAKFVLMVDFRGRQSASDFAGNYALPKAVIAKWDEFLAGPLANSAKPIHEAVKSADEAYFRAFVQYAGRGPPRKERALAVSSCARIPLYDVDFGYGAPAFAGINPPVPRLVPDFLLSLPSVTKEGFVVYLQLHKSVLKAVLDDEEFMAIAKKYRPFNLPSYSRI